MELFDRPNQGERAVLVHFLFRHGPFAAELDEFEGLVASAGITAVGTLQGQRSAPDSRHYIGRGKLDELQSMVAALDATLILFNHELSPSQERNLEKELNVRVIDRTELILDIFAQRAQSFEGKLQVELAQLKHLSTRLVRGWTHLERQKGGIGLRGPGETQLETDRRLIGVRIQQIRKRLDKVDKQRHESRRARKKADLPTVSLVGYTNAGKSTLFNALTESSIYAADQLFATLDPTLRKVTVPPFGEVVLADTVGFIQNLPHDLVAAFRSTLQETVQADLLLHVIDASSPHRTEQVAEVEQVLREIGADQIPQILVYNKIDQVPDLPARVDWDDAHQAQAIWLSALTGSGMDMLRDALSRHCQQDCIHRRVHIAADQGKIRSRLFEVSQILRDQPDDAGGWEMEIQIPRKHLYVIKDISS